MKHDHHDDADLFREPIRVIVVIVVIRVRSLMFSAGQDFVHPLGLRILVVVGSAETMVESGTVFLPMPGPNHHES